MIMIGKTTNTIVTERNILYGYLTGVRPTLRATKRCFTPTLERLNYARTPVIIRLYCSTNGDD